MIRFIDENTVIINDYSQEKPEFQRAFRMALNNAGLNWIEIPYNPYENKTSLSAQGIYLNYLQMENIVIVPIFNRKEYDSALKVLEENFKGNKIITIDCTDIPLQGGILNCISWNI